MTHLMTHLTGSAATVAHASARPGHHQSTQAAHVRVIPAHSVGTGERRSAGAPGAGAKIARVDCGLKGVKARLLPRSRKTPAMGHAWATSMPHLRARMG